MIGSPARDALDQVRSELEQDGRFRVMARIGEGGMGVVYRVHDHERGEDVALKTLKLPSPTRYCLGQVLGGEAGQFSQQRALAVFAQLGVKDPVRLIAALMPAFAL